MRAQLGWSMPLAVLPDWIQGRPARGYKASGLEYLESGQISAFTQLDWQVNLDRYRAEPSLQGERSLPHKLVAEKGDTRVRLVVSDWQI